MKYGNAAKGIKTVFVSELISLIGTQIIAFCSGLTTKDTTAAVVGMLVLALVVALIPGILQIVGLVKAGKDEPAFTFAWIVLAAFLLIQVIYSIVGAVDAADPVSTWLVEIMDALIAIMVLAGVLRIYRTKGIPTTTVKTAMAVFIVTTLIQSGLDIYSREFDAGVMIPFVVVIFVTEMIGYILYLAVLYGAEKKFLQ